MDDLSSRGGAAAILPPWPQMPAARHATAAAEIKTAAVILHPVVIIAHLP